MSLIIPPVGGPIAGQDRGLTVGTIIRPMTASGASFARGDLVQLDPATIDATSKAWTTVVAVADLATSATATAIYGVCLEAIAQNTTGRVGFVGDFDVFVTGSVAIGAQLVADADGTPTNRLVAAADDRKVLGFALAAISTAVGQVRFNGITGWGHAE